ncbi:MAG: hypothetical protein ABSB88_04370 [Bryobacteraceae bacterium]|jgi:hypothetical protein
MRPLVDAVMLTVTLHTAKAIDLYRLGGVIGLLLGGAASILSSQR